jgi:hypothetical protein
MLSSVAAHEFLDCARERERFAKRRSFAHFHDHARDASRRRFFAQLTKERVNPLRCNRLRLSRR